MTKPARKAQIAKCREAGRLARMEGKNRQSVPFNIRHSADADHWIRGWDEEDEHMRRVEVASRDCVVTDAISEVEDTETQAALYAIFEYMKERLP